MSEAAGEVACVATACGPFTVLAADGVVVASGWTADVTQLAAAIPSDARPGRWRPRRDLGPITAAVGAYLAGDLEAIVAVPVRQRSGPFVEAAWAALRTVPPGSSVTYQALAGQCGRPAAARAAGLACHRNAVALFVPCHRAVRGDGGLGGVPLGPGGQAVAPGARSECRGSDRHFSVDRVVESEPVYDIGHRRNP